MRVETSDLIIN